MKKRCVHQQDRFSHNHRAIVLLRGKPLCPQVSTTAVVTGQALLCRGGPGVGNQAGGQAAGVHRVGHAQRRTREGGHHPQEPGRGLLPRPGLPPVRPSVPYLCALRRDCGQICAGSAAL